MGGPEGGGPVLAGGDAADRAPAAAVSAPATATPGSTARATTTAPEGPARLAPMLLPPNPVFRFYRGGAGIDLFRGVAPGSGPGAPEDWVGSTTTSFGNDSEGLARLADGRLLRDAIQADPVAFLGARHAAALGANPGLLVKLLDAGERLAVHFHPGREFARAHLRSDFGKTEAWLVLRAEPGAHMHLGLRESLDPATLREWVLAQDSEAMLAALNRVPVSAGDALFVPAGTLHTIGAGITLVELQEPSDMSVVIEWRHAGVSGGDEHLQLGWETILAAADTAAAAPIHIPARPAQPGASGIERLLLAAADPYFQAQRLTLDHARPLELEPQFAILIATDGELTIGCEADAGEPLRTAAGDAALIPHGAGRTTVSGSGAAIRCLPPQLSSEPGAAAW